MKIELILKDSGRRVIATQKQADLLLKIGKAERVGAEPEQADAEEGGEGETKQMKAAPKANAKKGYNRRDMAGTAEEK